MRRRKIATGIVLLVIIGGGYLVFQNVNKSDGPVQYVTAVVEKGTLITSVSGSGQVSLSNQIDLKAKVSGDVVRIGVINGQEVAENMIIVELDTRDAEKAIRDAEINFESAQLALEKLKQPTDELTLLQAENDLAQAEEDKTGALDELEKVYEDGFNIVADAFLDFPQIVEDVESILFGENLKAGQANIDAYADAAKKYDIDISLYEETVRDSYRLSKVTYDQNFQNYSSASRNSTTQVIESLIEETYDSIRDTAETLKNANSFIDFYRSTLLISGANISPLASSQQSTLEAHIRTVNSHLTSLLAMQSTIQNTKEDIVNAERSIEERKGILNDLRDGADPLDIQSQELTVKQREFALQDAKEALADYYIRAPFAGIVVQLDIKRGEAITSSTVIGTLITKQKIAEASLNEIDAASVKVAQKVTLTFDALENLSITGQITEVDTIGTVTQGVVTYGVKIGFDTQDERVKPGMSVSAVIITNVRQNVLMVSNSAVQSRRDGQFVQILENVPENLRQAAATTGIPSDTSPRAQTVEVGLSNDLFSEILSGVSEGDYVVTRTIGADSSQGASQQGNSIIPFGRGRPR